MASASTGADAGARPLRTQIRQELWAVIPAGCVCQAPRLPRAACSGLVPIPVPSFLCFNPAWMYCFAKFSPVHHPLIFCSPNLGGLPKERSNFFPGKGEDRSASAARVERGAADDLPDASSGPCAGASSRWACHRVLRLARLLSSAPLGVGQACRANPPHSPFDKRAKPGLSPVEGREAQEDFCLRSGLGEERTSQ